MNKIFNANSQTKAPNSNNVKGKVYVHYNFNMKDDSVGADLVKDTSAEGIFHRDATANENLKFQKNNSSEIIK